MDEAADTDATTERHRKRRLEKYITVRGHTKQNAPGTHSAPAARSCTGKRDGRSH